MTSLLDTLCILPIYVNELNVCYICLFDNYIVLVTANSWLLSDIILTFWNYENMK